MFPHNNSFVRFVDESRGCLPVLSVTDFNLSDFPLSPSNQLMYEPDVGIDSNCGGSLTTVPSFANMASPENAISPSVEGMTFEDCSEMMKFVISDNNTCQNFMEVGEWLGTDLDMDEFTGKSELSGSSGLIGDIDFVDYRKQGPTLTQLNSDDLDSALFDDFDVLGDIFAQNSNYIKPQSSTFIGAENQTANLLQQSVNNGRVLQEHSTNPVFSLVALNNNNTKIGLPASSAKQVTCTVTSYTSSNMPPVVPGNPTLINFGSNLNSSLVFVKQEPDHNIYLARSSQAAAVTPEVINQSKLCMEKSVNPEENNIVSNEFICQSFDSSIGDLQRPSIKRSFSPTLVSRQTPHMTTTISEKSWEEIEKFLQNPENSLLNQISLPSAPFKKMKTDSEVQQDDGVVSSSFNNLEAQDESSDGNYDDNEENSNQSDAESNSQEDFLLDTTVTGQKDRRFFWQYNTQSKGPKGKRLCKTVENNDPHVLHDFEDPVFDPEQNQTRYKHNGKARRGDGNDVTPNPYKLFLTGNELRKLNKLINSMMPSNELPANLRSKTLKEKNKFASRACRLKKKAQHEANKLKLYGLEKEHRQLMKVLTCIKSKIIEKFEKNSTSESMSKHLELLSQRYLTLMVAGHTADFVNTVLQKVSDGDKTGGIVAED